VEHSRILEVFGDKRNAGASWLAIVGYAKIEETLDEGREAAFDEDLPKELRVAPSRHASGWH
jgi:hypothetical protein